MASRFEERLDKMIEAAKASDRPYRALEGRPFNLSPGIARTIVVGSGLSKSSDEVREREAKRIAKWREQGGFGKPKAPKPKVQQAAPVVEVADEAEVAPDEAVQIPEAVAEAVTEHAAKATRKRAPRKDGQASDTAKSIAANREPAGSRRPEPLTPLVRPSGAKGS